MRLDLYLFESGITTSRTKALELIKKGAVAVNSKIAEKPSYDVKDTDTVEILCETDKYVSRAAHKLLYAKEYFNIDFKSLVALDLGSSTGGFCQVMLESGIEEIFAVDIGHDQLHPDVRNDARVKVFEGVNARYIDTDLTKKKVDIVTADLSFISQTLVLEAVVRVLKEHGIYVGLIKPQFEVGRSKIGKNGIVKDKRAHADAIEKVILSANSLGLVCKGLVPSPIMGGDGNREFLAYYLSEGKSGAIPDRLQIESIVNES